MWSGRFMRVAVVGVALLHAACAGIGIGIPIGGGYVRVPLPSVNLSRNYQAPTNFRSQFNQIADEFGRACAQPDQAVFHEQTRSVIEQTFALVKAADTQTSVSKLLYTDRRKPLLWGLTGDPRAAMQRSVSSSLTFEQDDRINAYAVTPPGLQSRVVVSSGLAWALCQTDSKASGRTRDSAWRCRSL